MRSSHVDHPVGKELENSKRWLICVYLRGREVREVERKKASPHRAVSGRREGRYMPGSYVDDLQPASPPSSKTIVSKISAMIVRIEDRPLRSAIDNHHDPSYR
jgi:hypothetical protein